MNLKDIEKSYDIYDKYVRKNFVMDEYGFYTIKESHKEHLQQDICPELDDLLPFLYREHERYHHLQFLSTPVGYFTWRLTATIISSAQWIVSNISRYSQIDIDIFPLTEWLNLRGLQQIALSDQIPESRKRILVKFSSKLTILSRFLEAFLEKPAISVADFLKIANESADQLKSTSDLHVDWRWISRREAHASYLPEGVFSTAEIIEAGARLCEEQLLSQARNASDLLPVWEKQAIFGIYKPAYQWLKSQSLDYLELQLLAIDLALMSPVDLITARAVGGVVWLEDVHPGWRLQRIVEAMPHCFWSNTPEGRANFIQKVLLRAGLCPLKDIGSCIASSALNGPESWGADAILEGGRGGLNLKTVFTYIEDEFKTNMSARVDNPTIAIASKHAPLGEAMTPAHRFTPALEFYRDAAKARHTPVTDKYFDEGLHWKLYWLTVECLLKTTFLEDGIVSSDLLRIESAFVRMLQMEAEQRAQSVQSVPAWMYKVRDSAEGSYGRAASFLKWPTEPG
jgi:hypothetical protein